MFKTHYSTPSLVVFFLMRRVPEFMIRLQQGIFSPQDGYFKSIETAFLNCNVSEVDFRELTPEFFSLQTDLYVNVENMDLGAEEPVTDVELPLWAREAAHFAELMREALESDFVSEHLNEWIDLIFGCNQAGDSAESAFNLFQDSTYRGSIDWKSLKTDDERAGLQVLVKDFGQCPGQVFTDPHPVRQFRWTSIPGRELEDSTVGLRVKIEQLQGHLQSLLDQHQRELRDLAEEEKEELDSMKTNHILGVQKYKEKLAVLGAKRSKEATPSEKRVLRRNASLGFPRSLEGSIAKLQTRDNMKTRTLDSLPTPNLPKGSSTAILLQKRFKPAHTESSVRLTQTPLSTSRKASRRTKSITPPKFRPVTAMAQYTK